MTVIDLLCPSCRRPAPATAAWCGDCGAPGPATLAQWRPHCEAAAEDGVLDDAEKMELVHALASKGYRPQQHQAVLTALLAELGVALGASPVTLSIDAESVNELVVGRRTALVMRVENGSPSLVKGVRVDWRTGLEKGANQAALDAVGPAQSRTLSFDVQPEHAGRATLSGVVEFSDPLPSGRWRTTRWSFEQPLRIAGESSGPQSVSFSINANAARVMNTENLQFAQHEAKGGLATKAEWLPLALSPVGAGELVKRRLAMGLAPQDAFHVVPSNVPAGPRTLRLSTPAGEVELVVIAKPTVRFGRDLTKSDVRLAVEPFSPPEQFKEHVAKSMRISGAHLGVSVDRREVNLTDLGSSGGTFVGGRKLAPHEPVTLTEEPVAVRVADALELTARALYHPDGSPAGAWLQRVSNTTNRHYLVLTGAVGLEAAPGRLLGALDRAKVALVAVDGRVGMGNVSGRALGVEGAKLAPGATRALGSGEAFEGVGMSIRGE